MTNLEAIFGIQRPSAVVGGDRKQSKPLSRKLQTFGCLVFTWRHWTPVCQTRAAQGFKIHTHATWRATASSSYTVAVIPPNNCHVLGFDGRPNSCSPPPLKKKKKQCPISRKLTFFFLFLKLSREISSMYGDIEYSINVHVFLFLWRGNISQWPEQSKKNI